MIKDFNDTLEDAARVLKLVRGIPSKINLIPFNEHPGADYKRPADETVKAFQRYLMDRNLTTTVRISRGRDILAACGQLRTIFGTARGTEKHRTTRRPSRFMACGRGTIELRRPALKSLAPWRQSRAGQDISQAVVRLPARTAPFGRQALFGVSGGRAHALEIDRRVQVLEEVDDLLAVLLDREGGKGFFAVAARELRVVQHHELVELGAMTPWSLRISAASRAALGESVGEPKMKCAQV